MNPTINIANEIENLELAQHKNREAVASIKSQMLDLSARLRELRLEEGAITIRLINAHFESNENNGGSK